MTASHTLSPVFDDPNLVSHAGLVPVLRLAERAGLSELVVKCVTVPSPNAPVKVRTVVAGMLAGADSIDDLDVLRSGSTAKAVGPVRAPSTMGTFLRKFTHGHVLQLEALARKLLVNTAAIVPGLVGSQGLVRVDLDDTIREVHGYRKQAAAYGYSGVRGLNAIIAAVSAETSAPVVAGFGLRRGNVRSGANADWHLARTLSTVQQIAPGRRVIVRADSAFCTCDTIHAAADAGAWFSVTIPQWRTVAAAIGAIPENGWEAIVYPHAIRDPDTGEWISNAEVAETEFTAFVGRKKAEHVTCRLVVRRVKRLNENAKNGQETLFDTWRYHAFITNSTLSTVEADRTHRQHAIIEQVIEELKTGPLAHLPSGKFTANQAWLAFCVIAFNLSRAAAITAGMRKSRMATVLRKIIATPARVTVHARRVLLHLPQQWPWQEAWNRLWAASISPPGTAAA